MNLTVCGLFHEDYVWWIIPEANNWCRLAYLLFHSFQSIAVVQSVSNNDNQGHFHYLLYIILQKSLLTLEERLRVYKHIFYKRSDAAISAKVTHFELAIFALKKINNSPWNTGVVREYSKPTSKKNRKFLLFHHIIMLL